MKKRNLFIAGLAGTGFYLLLVLTFIIAKVNYDQALALNALGDFLAGLFGPIATFWLILGFIQQGEELRISSKALVVQTEELKQSVVAQTRMAEISEHHFEMAKSNAALEQARLAASIEPKFSVGVRYDGQDVNGVRFKIAVTNAGHTITCIESQFGLGVLKEFTHLPSLATLTIDLIFPIGTTSINDVLVLTYFNGLEERRERKFPIIFQLNHPNWEIDVLPRNGIEVPRS